MLSNNALTEVKLAEAGFITILTNENNIKIFIFAFIFSKLFLASKSSEKHFLNFRFSSFSWLNGIV